MTVNDALSRGDLPATVGTPAPRAFSNLGPRRVAVHVLCPERAMTRFSLGSFPRREAEAMRMVRCPVCDGTHVLVSTTAWVMGVAPSTREMQALTPQSKAPRARYWGGRTVK